MRKILALLALALAPRAFGQSQCGPLYPVNQVTSMSSIYAVNLECPPTTCAAGSFAQGIDQKGNAIGCTTPAQLSTSTLAASTITWTADQTWFNELVVSTQMYFNNGSIAGNPSSALGNTRINGGLVATSGLTVTTGNLSVNTGILSVDGVQTASVSTQTVGAPWIGTPAGSRATNTVYQNNTGLPIFVAFTGGGAANPQGLTDSHNPPTTQVATISVGSFENGELFMIVLPGNYYEVSTAGSLVLWTEWQ